jgi:hypothetical protein
MIAAEDQEIRGRQLRVVVQPRGVRVIRSVVDDHVAVAVAISVHRNGPTPHGAEAID